MKKLLLFILLFLTLMSWSQTVELVRHDYPGSSKYNKGNFKNLTAVGNLLYFVTDDGIHGTELFKSDGTEVGTVLVKDIYPGAGSSKSSKPSNLLNFNNQLFFSAYDGSLSGQGTYLWKSDGTEEGTVKVVEGGMTTSRLVIGNTLYFEKDDGSNLWKTDGTAEGTVLISESVFLENFTAFNDKLVFTRHTNDYGKELWISDGTAAGTELVKDINPGNSFDGSSIGNMTKLGNQLLFSANDGTRGSELWKTDGTEAGTVLVKDINPGNSGSSLSYFRNVNGTLFFSANDGVHGIELWKSDGTETGTVMVKDIRVGSVNFSSNSSPKDLIAAGNTLYFLADDGLTGSELWKSDGTAEGTVLIEDNYPGRNGSANNNTLVAYDDYIIYKGYTQEHGQEPWISDGTAEGTKMLKDINPGKFFEGKLQVGKGRITDNGIFFFLEHDGVNGKEPSLWKLDLKTLSLETENSNEFDKVIFYPNPTSDILNLKIENQQIQSIKIYSLFGKEVLKLSSKTGINSIDVSKLSSGMYVIQLKTSNNTFTKKIVKK